METPIAMTFPKTEFLRSPRRGKASTRAVSRHLAEVRRGQVGSPYRAGGSSDLRRHSASSEAVSCSVPACGDCVIAQPRRKTLRVVAGRFAKAEEGTNLGAITLRRPLLQHTAVQRRLDVELVGNVAHGVGYAWSRHADRRDAALAASACNRSRAHIAIRDPGPRHVEYLSRFPTDPRDPDRAHTQQAFAIG
jgi:hypothetical protein